MNIALAIKHKYPHLDPIQDFEVRSDENGMHLARWPESLGISRPTEDDLAEWYADYLATPQPVAPLPEELRDKRIADLEVALADFYAKGGK